MINRYSDVPLYVQLKNKIIEKINSGDFVEDTQIPSEQELCETYTISRPTVRQAISDLTASGYLYKAKGKGTFVSKKKSSVDIKNFSGFTDSILDSLQPGGKNILAFDDLTADEHKTINEIFGNKKESISDFVKIRYVSTINTDVLSYSVSYIPLSIFPNIVDDLKAKRSSFELLKGKYPYVPTKSRSSMEVIFSDSSDSALLQVQPGQPIVRFENVLSSKTGQAVEFVVSKFRTDMCKFVFENTK